MRPEEIIASDMPWAVAWYADRRELLVAGHDSRRITDFNDYNILGGRSTGSISRRSAAPTITRDILKGEYRIGRR